MTSDDRKSLLKRLVAYELPIEPIVEALSQFPFDSEQELVLIVYSDVIAVI
jgi:hypothetical protein